MSRKKKTKNGAGDTKTTRLIGRMVFEAFSMAFEAFSCASPRHRSGLESSEHMRVCKPESLVDENKHFKLKTRGRYQMFPIRCLVRICTVRALHEKMWCARCLGLQ